MHKICNHQKGMALQAGSKRDYTWCLGLSASAETCTVHGDPQSQLHVKPQIRQHNRAPFVYVFLVHHTGKLTGTNAKTVRLSELKSLTVPSENPSVTFRVEVVGTDKGA